MARRTSATSLEGQKVFVPDPDIGWVRATVVHALGNDRFEVSIDPDRGSDLRPKLQGLVTVDVASPDFGGLGSLPLQNSNLAQQGAEDMCALNYLHEPAILYNLRSRFAKQLPYTYTGEIVIATNPYKWLPIYGDELRAKYQKAVTRGELPPHVYATSSAAFKGLRDYSTDQSILVSGESGAGKTETVKILLDHLASVAGGEDDATIQKVVKTNPLLESFGNAKTVRNDNSSRFGKWLALRFNDRCRLVGSDINTYLLEKSRVVHHTRGERTYHIMYQILAAPDSERAKYLLGGKTKRDFKYTGVGNDTTDVIEGVTDGDRFKMTADAMRLIGVPQAQVDELFKSIAGVLFLGQLDFTQSHGSDGNQDGSAVTNLSSLEAPAQLLGTSTEQLHKHLTHRTMQARQETYEVPLNPEKAADSRDGLAKEIYFRLFAWLCDRINDSTSCASAGSRGTIGLLDIFGFESFVVNRFEQFCINYANEKLQQKFTLDVFKTVQVEYTEQGIPWEHIGYKDNAEVLNLIEGHRTGLLAILDEECVLPKGADEPFVSKAAKAHEKHPNFSKDKRSQALEFTVTHYAGAVTYNAYGFLDKNRDTIQEDLLEMLAGSSNALLQQVFAAREEEDLITGSVKVQARKGTLVHKSVGSKFKQQLESLMTAIQQTAVQYVRCIKPNKLKSATVLDNVMVVEQLRCAGVIEAIRISRAAFPNRLPFDEFTFRFQALAGLTTGADSSDQAAKCRKIINKLLPGQDSQYAIGTTKVYFRAAILEELEQRRGLFLRSRVVLIQSVLLGNLWRQRFLKWKKAVIVLQPVIRVFLAKRLLVRLRKQKAERERREKEEREARERAGKVTEADRKAKEEEAARAAALAAELAALKAPVATIQTERLDSHTNGHPNQEGHDEKDHVKEARKAAEEAEAARLAAVKKAEEEAAAAEPPKPPTPRTIRRKAFLEYHPRYVMQALMSGLRTFLSTPIGPEVGTVKCFVRRQKPSGMAKLKLGGSSSEQFFLYMEGHKEMAERLVMSAKKKVTKQGVYYILSMIENGSKDSACPVAKVKSVGKNEQFQIYDQGLDSRSASKTEVDETYEVAAVHWYSPPEGSGAPAGQLQMRVALQPPRPMEALAASLLDRMKRNYTQPDEPILINRNPKHNPKNNTFVLDFFGRVTEASLSNFQLTQVGDVNEKVVLQFGQSSSNEFNMDFTYPLTPLQAFAISLSSFGGK